MKQMKKFLAAAVIAGAAFLASGHVNAQAKMGYVNTDELTSIMPEMAKADSQFQQYRGALVQNAQDKQSSLEAAIEKFNKDSTTMTSAVKDVKRADLQKMLTDLQGEDQRIQQQLQAKQQELVQPITRKALETIQAVAKENGYTYVFEKNALIVAPPGEDILPLVAKKLNIKLPPAGQRAGAQPTQPAQQSPAPAATKPAGKSK